MLSSNRHLDYYEWPEAWAMLRTMAGGDRFSVLLHTPARRNGPDIESERFESFRLIFGPDGKKVGSDEALLNDGEVQGLLGEDLAGVAKFPVAINARSIQTAAPSVQYL